MRREGKGGGVPLPDYFPRIVGGRLGETQEEVIARYDAMRKAMDKLAKENPGMFPYDDIDCRDMLGGYDPEEGAKDD